jgi:Uma2 family endonuclease
MLPDGMTVRVEARTAFEPDALVYCGERLSGDLIEVPNLLIVVEVMAPGSQGQDTGTKLAGYFRVPSIAHYLIVDPIRRVLIHHRREGDGINARIASEGTLRLDPPGLRLPVEECFADP